MPVVANNVVYAPLTETELGNAVAFAYHALKHHPSYRFDPLNGFIQILIEELAERMVIHWLQANGKYVEAVTDKGATVPNLSHEIWITDIRGVKVRAAVHTFLSTNKSDMTELLESHSLSIETSQICGVNFSVVYWLQLHEKPRIKLPALKQSAIVGWVSDKNLRETLKTAGGFSGKFAALKLCELRPLEELLTFLV